jgi:hypothetical protein
VYGRRLAPFVPVPCECSGNGKAHQGATDHRKRREFDAGGERGDDLLCHRLARGENPVAIAKASAYAGGRLRCLLWHETELCDVSSESAFRGKAEGRIASRQVSF